MSLNKTLDRLFDEIRREAKRNPGFADRLDAVLRLHDSRRDVSDEVVEEVSSPARGGSVASEARDEGGAATRTLAGKAARRPLSQSAAQPDSSPAHGGAKPPAINPAGMFKREGEDALTAALAALDVAALRALVTEHNLDPSGAASALGHAELVTHIVAQAKKRADRDEKLFDY